MRATLTGQTPSSSPDSSEAARRQTAVLRSAGLGRVKANAGPCEQARPVSAPRAGAGPAASSAAIISP